MFRPVVLFLATAIPLSAQDRQQILDVMRRAAEHYRNQVSTQSGYHPRYATDSSFGRSEQAEGPTQISVQSEGTPSVGMAFLEAWRATGDPQQPHGWIDQS